MLCNTYISILILYGILIIFFLISGGGEIDLKVSVMLRVSGPTQIHINVQDIAIGSFDLYNLTDITYLTVKEEFKVEVLQFKYS